MTDGLSQLENSIKNAASSGKYDGGCVEEVLNTVESFKSIFSSVEALKMAFDDFRKSNGCCPVEKLSKIAKEIDHSYFDSMTTSSMAFRMVAMDLGELLLKFVVK